MPDNVRLLLILLCICVVGYIIFNMVDSAISDNLEDKSIGIMYKQQNALIKDSAAMKQFLEQHLDETYQRTGDLVYAMDGKPDQVIPIDTDKKAAIDMALQGMGAMKLSEYSRGINGIKHSPDLKYAYVSTAETSKGMITFTLAPEKTTSMWFESASNCIDTITIVHGTTHWLATQCKQKIALFEKAPPAPAAQ